MKSFRDPVHNLIAFDESDLLIVDLINTKEVQRLRRIRQLGMSNIAYPGAEHSRFLHSLGVAHLMRRFLDLTALQRGPLESELYEFRHLAIAAALLHDLGHGPFSHALESVTGERHEKWTTAIIRSPETEVHQVLETYLHGFSDQVASVIEQNFSPSRAIVKLLSSQLDMDRTDYLLRDSLFTGAGYGTFDVEWLLHVMRIGEVNGEVEVGLDLKKGQSIAEDYIMSRYYMYLHVYFHRTTRAAEVMMEKMLKRAQDIHATIPGLDGLNQLLGRQLQSHLPGAVSAYLELDDAILWAAMHLWTHDSDEILRDLSSRLLDRKLFRGIDVRSAEEGKTVYEAISKKVTQRGLSPEYYLVLDEVDSHTYQDNYVAQSDGKGTEAQLSSKEIYLFDEAGRAVALSQTSFLVEAVRQHDVSVQRVFTPGDRDEQ